MRLAKLAILAALFATPALADECLNPDAVKKDIVEAGAPQSVVDSLKPLSDADFATLKASQDVDPSIVTVWASIIPDDGSVFVVGFDKDGCYVASGTIDADVWAKIFGG